MSSAPSSLLKPTGADPGNGIEALSEALQNEKENRSHDFGVELKSRLVTRFPSEKPQSTISQLPMSSKKALKSFSFTMNKVSCCDPAE